MLTGTQTSPYTFKTGSTVDFKSRSIDASVSKYFPVDREQSDSDIPTYIALTEANAPDTMFHFESFAPLHQLPYNLFAVRVTVLTDATLLGFRVPHDLCDGGSLYEIIKAYRAIIAGTETPQFVPPPDIGRPMSKMLRDDPGVPLPLGVSIENVQLLNPNEAYLAGFGPFLRFVVYLFWVMFARKLGLMTRSEERLIHLSGNLVERWRSECQEELDQSALLHDQGRAQTVMLTKLDVISAWFLKVSPATSPYWYTC